MCLPQLYRNHALPIAPILSLSIAQHVAAPLCRAVPMPTMLIYDYLVYAIAKLA